MDSLPFSPATTAWLRARFAVPTPVQARGWAAIAKGQDTLLLAPTGSGKTLAAFLWAIDRLIQQPSEELRILYVSPLKALAADIQRNLETPLLGIAEQARALDLPMPAIRVEQRTGDTDPSARRRFTRAPPQILVTTPESLFLLLSSAARERLRTVRTVIVDEIHALAGNKRGVHLALSLERLAALGPRPPQRIGLSATQRPLEEIAAFLGGAQPSGAPRPVAIIDASAPPALKLSVEVPLDDLDAQSPPALAPLPPGAFPADHLGPWPAIHQRLLERIRAHRSTLVFTNSRRLCERLAWRLGELSVEAGLPQPFALAHHGSTSPEERARVEGLLKSGQLPALVATGTLELGIDMGAIDQVLLVESPGAVSRALQRVGRAGHQVGGTSEGAFLPRHGGELWELAALVPAMRRGEVEATRVPRTCLDVLAQQLVSLGLERDWPVRELLARVRGAWPYAGLDRTALEAVLDMLAGRLPGALAGELRPRIVWDRAADTVRTRPDARPVLVSMAGTIPDRGTFGVYLTGEAARDGDGRTRRRAAGRRLGELDEEMVYETRRGEVIRLGASTWRVVEIQHDRVLVQPAPGEPGKMPFWRGEGPGRPPELGRAMGALARELLDLDEDQAHARLQPSAFDRRATRNLLLWMRRQRERTGSFPTDRSLSLERFRDETGDEHLAILGPLGARVFGPWALALQARLSPRNEAGEIDALQLVWSDEGILMRFPDLGEGSRLGVPGPDALLIPPEEVEALVVERLQHSPLLAGRFREAAARSLLLWTRRPGRRTPLWAQRQAAQRLQGIAAEHPAFPITLEALRECLLDLFDLPALQRLLQDLAEGTVRLVPSRPDGPTPLVQGLRMRWTEEVLYAGELVGRPARSTPIDPALLARLLGRALPPAPEAALVAEVLAERAPRRRPGPDGLHDLLRARGPLPEGEADAQETAALLAEGRALLVEAQGATWLLAAEDAALHRDARGWELPASLPEALRAPVPGALGVLVERHIRTHGPRSVSELARALGLPPGAIDPALQDRIRAGRLVPVPWATPEPCWVDPDLLARIQRRQAARRRAEVQARPAADLARLQLRRHGLAGEAGRADLEAVLDRLQGCRLPASELFGRILPQRLPGFRPEALDLLGLQGRLAWTGAGRIHARDLWVVLAWREEAALLFPPPPPPPQEPLALHLLAHIEARGACFTHEILAAVPAGARREDALEALALLMSGGWILNDAVQPILGLLGGRALHGGRWSARRTLAVAEPEPTASALAWSRVLLDRHGVLAADAVLAEGLAGGIGPLIPVLDALEERGQLRRGHFIAGLDGVQRASTAAALELAGLPAPSGEVRCLGSVDPGNPWGLALPWPEPCGEARPRRAAGATVVLRDGAPALHIEAGGRQAVTWPALDGHEAPVLAALARHLGRFGLPGLRLERIDGLPATASPRRDALCGAGLVPGLNGLCLDAAL